MVLQPLQTRLPASPWPLGSIEKSQRNPVNRSRNNPSLIARSRSSRSSRRWKASHGNATSRSPAVHSFQGKEGWGWGAGVVGVGWGVGGDCCILLRRSLGYNDASVPVRLRVIKDLENFWFGAYPDQRIRGYANVLPGRSQGTSTISTL